MKKYGTYLMFHTQICRLPSTLLIYFPPYTSTFLSTHLLSTLHIDTSTFHPTRLPSTLPVYFPPYTSTWHLDGISECGPHSPSTYLERWVMGRNCCRNWFMRRRYQDKNPLSNSNGRGDKWCSTQGWNVKIVFFLFER